MSVKPASPPDSNVAMRRVSQANTRRNTYQLPILHLRWTIILNSKPRHRQSHFLGLASVVGLTLPALLSRDCAGGSANTARESMAVFPRQGNGSRRSRPAASRARDCVLLSLRGYSGRWPRGGTQRAGRREAGAGARRHAAGAGRYASPIFLVFQPGGRPVKWVAELSSRRNGKFRYSSMRSTSMPIATSLDMSRARRRMAVRPARANCARVGKRRRARMTGTRR